MSHIKRKSSIIIWLSRISSGWLVGFEPTTFRTTIWRSNRLNYSHHVSLSCFPFRKRCKGTTFFWTCKLLSYFFCKKNRRICNYLRIKRLFGLHGNWVTRWQPFLFQSSLLFCTNVITLCNKGITFLWIGKKVVKISLYRCDYLNLVYHQSVIF